jgi:very-short-patch-repair endonuclease
MDDVLRSGGGVATRRQLLTVADRHRIDWAMRRGELVRLLPRILARPWDADSDEVRLRAAVLFAGPGAGVSHVTALTRWRLPAPPTDEVHVTTTRRLRSPRSSAVVVHHSRFALPVVPIDGVGTVGRAHAIVQSWPMLTGADQRAPLLVATRERLVAVNEVLAVAAGGCKLAGVGELRGLAEAISAGCRSELELWGYRDVFDVPGLRHAVRQRAVQVGARRYLIDMAYEEERVAVELDGRAYHAAADQWERDIRRDLALATLGWQTIRLSHRRLTTDPIGCRRDVLSVLAGRRDHFRR